MPTVRTGESTCIGHPDKLCDLIADTILDDLLVTDPAARCAVEVMATKGRIIAAGVSTSLEARDGNESAFVLTGAGDQGTVYGYATAETRERLPLLVIAHDICKRLDTARVDGVIRGIGSDGKSQVSLRYDDDGHATDMEAVVVSIQHTKDTDLEELRRQVTNLITPAFVSTVTTFDPG
ncbi:S-adenosylmethionine synthetase N-terminal domain-containing protein [uncultured Corynebacterium sp.]|uniref:S-adenosylmethionine synthetase N-terminal domain-containing protein n=1 Tax=uncultured Corynebacterium sp. TaxID=159447 RepID=UPI0025944473|nr:S-adenosylmethionine synthetase N-terminal domain-containing protein [uncultured Corynebacterium sp.]